MITKKDILKMVRTVYRHSRGLPPRRLIYPAREWGIGIVATALLLLLSVVGNGFAYLSFNTIEDAVEPASVSAVRYQEHNVTRTLELYADRSGTFAQAIPARPLPATTTASSTPSTATSTSTTTPDVNAAEPEEATSDAPLQVF